jgi:acyl carrier protein phosphodiesterase
METFKRLKFKRASEAWNERYYEFYWIVFSHDAIGIIRNRRRNLKSLEESLRRIIKKKQFYKSY